MVILFFSSRRRHTRCALVTGVQRVLFRSEWDAGNKRNSWTFGDPNRPPQPLELPRIRRAAITQSGLTYRDPELRLFADIDIDTVRATGTRIDDDIGFSGRGTMRAQPFTLSGGLKSPNETIAGGKNRSEEHTSELQSTRLNS